MTGFRDSFTAEEMEALGFPGCDNCGRAMAEDDIHYVYDDGQTIVCSPACARELKARDRARAAEREP